MRFLVSAAFMVGFLYAGGAGRAADLPAAIFTDPAPDKDHPARMVVLHIPSGDVSINGVAYVASGEGPHPAVILLHGLPGNEKNLDLAQAIRRAGWTVVTFNYRGSWGSPGVFRFGQNLDDAAAVLAYVREPAHAASLSIDPARLVMIGHSMGGWVAVNAAARDGRLLGLATLSAADMARMGTAPEAVRETLMSANMESLAGVTAKTMSADAADHATAFPLVKAAPSLIATPYLALTADDGLAGDTDGLVAAIRAKGGTKVTTSHMATDHGWNDHRIAMEAVVLDWLTKLHG